MFPFADTIPTQRWSFVTYAIVIVNVLALVWLQSLPEKRQQEVVAQRGFVAARISQLRDPRLVVEVPVEIKIPIPFGHLAGMGKLPLPSDPPSILLSTITCMFLHGGWMHLIGNMWFLLIFGNNVEDRLGHVMYAVFYLLGGWAATATQYVIGPHSVIPMIGASGAVAAVLGAYFITFPHARIKTLVFIVIFATIIEVPAPVFMVIWFGMQLFSGLHVINAPMESVAWWAHVGGFVAGIVIMKIFTSIIPDTKHTPPDDPLGPAGSPDWPRHFDDRGW